MSTLSSIFFPVVLTPLLAISLLAASPAFLKLTAPTFCGRVSSGMVVARGVADTARNVKINAIVRAPMGLDGQPTSNRECITR